MRSPSDSIAADIAETRSSSTPCGNAEAMLNPSTLTMAEASISGDEACSSRKRSTICCVRFFDNLALHETLAANHEAWFDRFEAFYWLSNFSTQGEAGQRRAEAL